MKTKPILFSTPMVVAIMNGSKTQTRRIVKYNKTIENPTIGFSSLTDSDQFEVRGIHKNEEFGISFFKLPYSKGDIMWVRETFAELYDYEDHPELDCNMREEWDCGYWYKTDGDLKKATLFVKDNKWKPSIYMPKKACRNFLKTTKVRVERVQAISESDAIAEGILFYDCDITKGRFFKDYLTKEDGLGHPDYDYPTVRTAKESFKTLWISINGQESWDDNPYVWVYDFEKTDKPKDFV